MKLNDSIARIGMPSGLKEETGVETLTIEGDSGNLPFYLEEQSILK